MRSRWRKLALWIVVLSTTVSGCGTETSRQAVQLSGPTMGTRWNVTLVIEGGAATGVDAEIQQILDRVNGRMSTWLADSELSLLNQTPPGQWLPVSDELLGVLAAAREVSEKSGGAFDATVGPLVSLWGFGARAADRDVLPAADAIAAARAQVDFRQVELQMDPGAARRTANVTVDLSAIAKGYAVDAVADHLEAAGYGHYLVEVGGEVRVRGSNASGKPWRLGIERPDTLARQVAERVSLSCGAIATSGDYRNFRVDEGVRRSHTIDPRTGQPVEHNVASVTVIADRAMDADAWATAMNVIGAGQGLQVATDRAMAVLFIMRTDDGFSTATSAAMDEVLAAGRTDSLCDSPSNRPD